MAASVNKRVYPRYYYKAPISYALYTGKHYYDATMYNYSIGGMYFETAHAPRRGTQLYIKMINFAPDVYVPGAYKAYAAEVKWCKAMDDTNLTVFGVGVQYIAKSHIMYAKEASSHRQSCDLCGGRMASEQIHKTEDALCLCLECFKHIGGLSNGKIRQSIMRFMIGNVV